MCYFEISINNLSTIVFNYTSSILFNNSADIIFMYCYAHRDLQYNFV
jgi:hypothetical protein